MKKLNWHNPDRVTSKELQPEEGWRFLLKEELSDDRGIREDIQRWSYKGWDSSGWQGDGNGTYRVKWPLPDWAVSRKLEQPELPEGLPPLPKLPAGWKWEYKGMGWKSEESARYAVASNSDSEWVTGVESGDIPEYGEVWGEPNQHYILAVEDKQEGWIKWSDRQPVGEDLPILCCVAGHTAYTSYALSIPVGYTHWMHDNTPPVPPRELTQEEKDDAAFQEWLPDQNVSQRKAFFAGVSYARKQP